MFQQDGKFQTMSGRVVTTREDGTVVFDHVNGYLTPEASMDAEEYYQAKRDRDLGRWRWPENPDYVVYPNPDESFERMFGPELDLVILHEPDGMTKGYVRAEDQGGPPMEHRVGHMLAARAYFEAHPERKPWQDAKSGEVWALTVDGAESAFYPSRSLSRHFTPVAPETGRTAVAMDSFEITDGRCIWPEPIDAEIVEVEL